MSTEKKTYSSRSFYPHPLSPIKTQSLQSGEVGVVVLGLKTVGDVQVGDTITLVKTKPKKP